MRRAVLLLMSLVLWLGLLAMDGSKSTSRGPVDFSIPGHRVGGGTR